MTSRKEMNSKRKNINKFPQPRNRFLEFLRRQALVTYHYAGREQAEKILSTVLRPWPEILEKEISELPSQD